MKQNLRLYLYDASDAYLEETECISLSIEREAYTPYEAMTAVFLSHHADYSNITRIALFLDDVQIFLGIADMIEHYTRNHVSFIRIQSKSFTSVLTQNELPAGLHSNLTMAVLMTKYYHFPYISYENPDIIEYIFVKSGNTMWDGVVSFGYKIRAHYPYVVGNHIYLSRPADSVPIEIHAEQVLAYGSLSDTTKLISHYHMDSFTGEPNGYEQENTVVTMKEITRHKQIAFDQSFMYAPQNALTFRNLYAQRGMNAKYVVIDGFENINIGQKLTFGDFIQNEFLCRVRITFNAHGFQTKLWCYHDGFYHNS